MAQMEELQINPTGSLRGTLGLNEQYCFEVPGASS